MEMSAVTVQFIFFLKIIFTLSFQFVLVPFLCSLQRNLFVVAANNTISCVNILPFINERKCGYNNIIIIFC